MHESSRFGNGSGSNSQRKWRRRWRRAARGRRGLRRAEIKSYHGKELIYPSLCSFLFCFLLRLTPCSASFSTTLFSSFVPTFLSYPSGLSIIFPSSSFVLSFLPGIGNVRTVHGGQSPLYPFPRADLVTEVCAEFLVWLSIKRSTFRFFHSFFLSLAELTLLFDTVILFCGRFIDYPMNRQTDFNRFVFFVSCDCNGGGLVDVCLD